MVPQNIADKFTRNLDIHNYNTRHKEDFHVTTITKQFKLLSTNQKGIRLWNALPKCIKDCSSILCF